MRERPFHGDYWTVDMRITPARAGKTGWWTTTRMTGQDHPRSCGKDPIMGGPFHWSSGSPPLVRERLRNIRHEFTCFGITPARAGKTRMVRAYWWPGRDHPRSCGKDMLATWMLLLMAGSPPLVRERRSRGRGDVYADRITPARAGKTVMDPLILANFFLPVFKIYLTSLQDI